MGWNPNINFQLRDDQVTFGDLIIDKNGIPAICDALKAIKAGRPLDTTYLTEIVQAWCFENDEFNKLKEEFEQIKIDIVEFKGITSNFGAKWTASINAVGASIDYIVGSSTWIEKYKENKSIAAGLYQVIKASGYTFSPEKDNEYRARYIDVMQATTQTECVQQYLKKQYQENLAQGKEDALKVYCDALVETGCITKEQAAKKMQMMGFFEGATGRAKKVETVEVVENTTEEEEIPKTEPVKPEQHRDVIVDSARLIAWHDAIFNRMDFSSDEKILRALSYYDTILRSVYADVGLLPEFMPKMPENNREAIVASINSLYSIMTMQQNRGLIDTSDVYVDGDLVHDMYEELTGSDMNIM